MTYSAVTWFPPHSPAILKPADESWACADKRRIVLVDLYWTRDKDPRVPLGHAVLLAALRSEPTLESISVVLPVNAVRSLKRIERTILAHTEGLPSSHVDIAIGAYCWNEHILQKLLPRLRAGGFKGRIILGGPQITDVSSGVEQLYPQADIFIRGQAEAALLETARTGHRRAIPGVHYAGEKDEFLKATVSLESMPSPLLNGIIPVTEKRFLRWETRRGCQFACTFCQHRQATTRIGRVAFPTSRVMAEIDLMCSAGVDDIAVLDPVFNTNEDPDHAIRVLNRFVENSYRGRIALQCRAELVTTEFLDVAGRLNVCLEFGLQTVHKLEQDAIERRNSMPKVDKVLAEVRKRGIDHEVSLIFGLPEQTLDSFQESVRWCLERKVPVIKAFPLLLLRGTKLDSDRGRWNLVEQDATMSHVIQSSTFTRRDWESMQSISQALSKTEGNHPDLQELLRRARSTKADRERFQPPGLEEAL